MTNFESILTKIKKLQALTEARGATPEEAATAAAKVQALLFEHNISMAQLDSHNIDEKTEALDKHTLEMDNANSKNVAWKRSLYHLVAKYNFCRTCYESGTTRTHVIGKKSNVEVVQYLATYLSREIERLATEATRIQLDGKMRFRTSFCAGAVAVIGERLREQWEQSERQAEPSSTALVVVSQNALQAAFRRFFPRTITNRGQRMHSDTGYQAGREAGRNISLTRGVGYANANQMSGYLN